MSDLRTDFVDDILATSENGTRKFNIVDAKGDVLYEGVHLEDVTNYLQVGDEYGADEINEQNTAINQINSDLSDKANIITTQGWKHTANITCDMMSGGLAVIFSPIGITLCATASSSMSIYHYQRNDSYTMKSQISGLSMTLTVWADSAYTQSTSSLWSLMPIVGNWTLTVS